MLYYNQTTNAVLKSLGTTANGLSNTEASKRLQEHGPNIIKVKGDPLWRKIVEPFANVFMLVLFLAAGISILHGDTLDAIIIISIMAASALIYYIQRFSTERILRSLQKHNAQAVEVHRDGKTKEIDTTKLVPGDIMLLGEGQKIPADARIISAQSLQVDESLLTGESIPVDKTSDAITGKKEVYEQTNILFQGAFIVSGLATAVVIKTGNETEFGQLAALSKSEDVVSPVQKKIDKLISQIIAVVAAVAVVAFLLSLRNGVDMTDSLRFVMALSVSAVPESLPVAISVILVLGMRRMAARKALVRNMRAIETVGVLTTIATDKTGTLTKNKLTVQETWNPEGVSTVELSKTIGQSITQSAQKKHDPLDIALDEYISSQKAHPKNAPLVSIPFDQILAMSGNVWHIGSTHTLAVKGAPEHILARCLITEEEHEEATKVLHSLTGRGFRVIALASTKLKKPIDTFHDLPKKQRFEFCGFVAVADVLRPEAKRAIHAALNAGVTVRMITGDHFETAYHIAKQLGMISHRNEVFDSRKMSVMTDEELEKNINNIKVFSRVVPENKYRILALLKKHNITAMTGDGVNDVPALANAHVGVAMGSGSQIAKDAGDIILLDDNFKSIIDAMQEGRTIISNIRRMLFYLLSTNAGEAITMLGALIAGMPTPLVPVQILWINLVTDTSLVIPLGLEPGEKDAMKRKPQKPNAPILSKYIVSRMILVALSMAVTTLVLYAIFSQQYGHEYGRTIAFCALVVMQWSNALNARSDYESVFTRLTVFSGTFYIGLLIAVGLQALAIFGPLQSVLHVHPVSIGDMFTTGLVAFIIPIIISEFHKLYGRRKHL